MKLRVLADMALACRALLTVILLSVPTAAQAGDVSEKSWFVELAGNILHIEPQENATIIGFKNEEQNVEGVFARYGASIPLQDLDPNFSADDNLTLVLSFQDGTLDQLIVNGRDRYQVRGNFSLTLGSLDKGLLEFAVDITDTGRTYTTVTYSTTKNSGVAMVGFRGSEILYNLQDVGDLQDLIGARVVSDDYLKSKIEPYHLERDGTLWRGSEGSRRKLEPGDRLGLAQANQYNPCLDARILGDESFNAIKNAASREQQRAILRQELDRYANLLGSLVIISTKAEEILGIDFSNPSSPVAYIITLYKKTSGDSKAVCRAEAVPLS